MRSIMEYREGGMINTDRETLLLSTGNKENVSIILHNQISLKDAAVIESTRQTNDAYLFDSLFYACKIIIHAT